MAAIVQPGLGDDRLAPEQTCSIRHSPLVRTLVRLYCMVTPVVLMCTTARKQL